MTLEYWSWLWEAIEIAKESSAEALHEYFNTLYVKHGISTRIDFHLEIQKVLGMWPVGPDTWEDFRERLLKYDRATWGTTGTSQHIEVEET